MAAATKTKPDRVLHECVHCGRGHSGKNNSRFCSADCRLADDQRRAAVQAAKLKAKETPKPQRPTAPSDPIRFARVRRLAQYGACPSAIAAALRLPIAEVESDLRLIPADATAESATVES